MNLSVAPKEIAGHGLLDGKVVVVTAAAGTGIGSATARRALAEGADVVISTTMNDGWGRRPPSCLRWGWAGWSMWCAT